MKTSTTTIHAKLTSKYIDPHKSVIIVVDFSDAPRDNALEALNNHSSLIIGAVIVRNFSLV